MGDIFLVIITTRLLQKIDTITQSPLIGQQGECMTNSSDVCKQLYHCGIIVLLFQLEICHRLSDITEIMTQIDVNL